MSTINQLVRKNILNLHPYSCARDEFQGEASIFLDANENPYNDPYNRYPDPLQRPLKEKIAAKKDVRPSQIMIGNGSDEPIDLIIRIFCEPSYDNILAIAPTYGMYKVCADINNVEYNSVLLDENFQLDADNLLAAVNERTKVIFLCSPNNPSGNTLSSDEIKKIADNFGGILVIDEAYIDFSPKETWLINLNKYPNLIILQTFSKAWGLASVRCGMAFASEEIISFFNKVKYPYNINRLTQEFIFRQIDRESLKNSWVELILRERPKLQQALEKISFVEKVFPSDSNFFLVRVKDANRLYKQLADKGIVVRNRSNIVLCKNTIRITIGSEEENKKLIDTLISLENV